MTSGTPLTAALQRHRAGDLAGAVALYDAALAAHPGEPGISLLRHTAAGAGDLADAFGRYLADPAHAGSRRALVDALAAAGLVGDPAAAHEDCLAFLLSRGGVAPPGLPVTVPTRYIRDVFDQLAPRYDALTIGRAGYQGATRLMAQVTHALAGRVVDVALDAGCGNGAAGPALRACARRLEGVDLSEGMAQIAAARGCYDDVAVGDLGAWLDGHPASYDLIVCCGVLGAFLDLPAILPRLAAALRPRGMVALTVDCHDDGGPPSRFSALGCQMYTHAPAHVLDQLERARLDVTVAERYVDRVVGPYSIAALLAIGVAP